MPKFQLKLAGDWKDFDSREEEVLKEAFNRGDDRVTFEARGQEYVADFTKMLQTNTKTGKTRELRVVAEDRPHAKAKAAPRPVPGPYGGPAAEQALHGATPGAYGGPAHGHGRPGHGHGKPEYGHGGGYAPQPGHMVGGRPVSGPSGPSYAYGGDGHCHGHHAGIAPMPSPYDPGPGYHGPGYGAPGGAPGAP